MPFPFPKKMCADDARFGLLHGVRLGVFGLALATAWPAGLAAQAPEYCAPGTTLTVASGVFPQPESTRRMVARLKEISQSNDQHSTFFHQDKLAASLLEKMRAATDANQVLAIKLPYAEALLYAGQYDAALKEFGDFERLSAENHHELPSVLLVRVLTDKAVCCLRIGELENCMTNHNADSCLLPIHGGGVHKNQRGSREAITYLGQLLRKFPGDVGARWLLNIAYMTLGEYPDQVPAAWVIDPKVFKSDYDLKRFPDVAGALGLDIDGLAGGVVMDDFDNDGFLDLMVSGWGPDSQLRLFHNNGDGTFTDRTAQAGLLGETGGLNLIQADYNNDGFVDVLVLRGAWQGANGHYPMSLLRNNGDGTFTDVTEEAGLLSYHPTPTAVWFDYNGDGWLDLFVGHESTGLGTKNADVNPCELFRNNGDGTFTECAAQNGVAIVGFVKAAVSADFENTGRPGLFISRLDGANILLRNDGPAGPDKSPSAPWRFIDVAKAAGVTEPFSSFSCWFWDYDNDGWPDIMVTGYSIQDVGDIAADRLGLPSAGERARLYHNNHDGTFSDVTKQAGLYKVLHTMGCNFGDLDNDGWLDFFVGTGDPDFSTLAGARMFRNDGGKRFQDVTTAGGFGQLQKGHGIAFGDINNSGFQDIYFKVGGAVASDHYQSQLFANPGNSNHWLKLKLEGVRSNRSAIGARTKVVVRTEDGEREIYRTVGSGGSFGASPLRQEIGLGQASSIVRAEIFWPATGITQIVTGLELDHAYLVREGDSSPLALKLRTFRLPTGGNSRNEVTASGVPPPIP
jgi:hypothetical protein